MSKTDLSVHILKQFHGELVAKVGECLIRSGCASLRQLTSATGVPQAKVQRALLILIQHGMMEFDQSKHGFIEYKIDVGKVIHRLQFPKVVQCAGHLYGDAAEMLVEELLHEGQTPMNTIVTTVTDRLNDALKRQGAEEIQPSLVRDKFERLVNTHFIKRCSVPVKNENGRVVSLDPQPQKWFIMPPKGIERAGGAVKVKQEADSEASGEPPTKKARFSVDDDHTIKSESDDAEVYWEVNHLRFLLHFRDQVLIAAVASRLDSEKPGEILRAILRTCETTTNPTDAVSVAVSFNEIHSQLPRDLGMTRPVLEQWLKIITDNMPEFVSRVAGKSGGEYSVNIFKALQALCTAHIESVVEERFGSKSLRIFRVILQKKQVEQSTVEKCVLMPANFAKELLYKMFMEHFVHVTELARTPDHAPSRTFYLFNVDIKKVARMLLDHSYKALKNMLIKRQLVLSENKRLLDKQERVNAIIATVNKQHAELLAARQGEENEEAIAMLEEERQQELKAIEEMITPSEKEQLERVQKFSNYLEASELQLDGTIFLLENFLDMTYKPPIPKPVKDFLNS